MQLRCYIATRNVFTRLPSTNLGSSFSSLQRNDERKLILNRMFLIAFSSMINSIKKITDVGGLFPLILFRDYIIDYTLNTDCKTDIDIM